MNKLLMEDFSNWEQLTNAIKKERQLWIETLAVRPELEFKLLCKIIKLSDNVDFYTDETLAFGHRLLKLDKEKQHAASTYNLIGQIYNSRKEMPKAKECYYKAISADPGKFEPILELAGIYEDEGDIESALKTYEFFDSPEMENGREAMYSHMGNLYGRIEDWQMAVEFLNKAILCCKEYKLLHENKGSPVDPKAFETWKEQLISHSGNDQAHFHLGNLYHLDDFYMAMYHYTESLKINPDMPEAYYNMAMLALKNQEANDECAALLLKAITELEERKISWAGHTTDIDRLLTILYLNLGVLYESMGSYEKSARFKYRYLYYKDLVISDPYEGPDFV